MPRKHLSQRRVEHKLLEPAFYNPFVQVIEIRLSFLHKGFHFCCVDLVRCEIFICSQIEGGNSNVGYLCIIIQNALSYFFKILHQNNQTFA